MTFSVTIQQFLFCWYSFRASLALNRYRRLRDAFLMGPITDIYEARWKTKKFLKLRNQARINLA